MKNGITMTLAVVTLFAVLAAGFAFADADAETDQDVIWSDPANCPFRAWTSGTRPSSVLTSRDSEMRRLEISITSKM